MPRGSLKIYKHLRKKIVEYIKSTLLRLRELIYPNTIYDYIIKSSDFILYDVLNLCYCLSSIVSNVAGDLTNSEDLTIETRKGLHDMIFSWVLFISQSNRLYIFLL